MKITVFTPTYNRAHLLHNLYASLQRQTYQAFEWLVVDDGSSDHTPELFECWLKEENSFPVRYYRQPNGGKCSAINKGLELAQGELFFTVDSDDYLTDDALEKIVRWEAALPKDQNYCGLAGNLGTSPGQASNRTFDGGYFDGTALDRYTVADGERAMVFYTRIHRQYPYPVFPGERFMTEAVAWNRMAGDGYRFRFHNDIIWVYEYKEDGLTKAGARLFVQNPAGYGLFLREKADFEKISFFARVRMWYTFACDLSGLYSSRQIASFILAPYPVIAVFNMVHRGRKLLRK